MTINTNLMIILVCVALLVVAALTIWKGGSFTGKFKNFFVKAEGRKPQQTIQVLQDLDATDMKARNVIGSTSDQTDANIDVLGNATIRRGEFQDIIGGGSPNAVDPSKDDKIKTRPK